MSRSMSIEPLKVLVGTWEMTGRSFDADKDNVFGTVTGTTILDDSVLQLAGTIRVGDTEIESLELIWPEPETGDFGAHVYSSMGPPIPYRWARTGASTLLHAGSGATYHGTISADGATITGSWAPDPGQPVHAGSSYDAVMRRI
jgi:hypothetical protein